MDEKSRKLPKRLFAKFCFSKKSGEAWISCAESAPKLLWDGEIIEVGEYRLVRSGYFRMISSGLSRVSVQEVKKPPEK